MSVGADLRVVRLGPGEDLREALARAPRELGFAAGFILSAVGSLRPAMLRLAGHEAPTRLDDDLELLLLSGTLGPDGPHLHAAVADSQGRVTGGHLAAGSIVRTTAEIVIGCAPGWRFLREPDPRTGYRELRALRERGDAEPG